jgi:hypothetical protein
MHACTCASTYTYVCVCVCIGAQVCVHVCLRMWARAGDACTRMCVCRFCSCIISALETFSGAGLHALLILHSGASVSAAEHLAVKPGWLLLNYVRDSLPRDTAVK